MTSEHMNEMTFEQEKSQKSERSRLETLWWAVALLWAGVVFGADSLGLLPQIGQADAWSWVFFGAGLFGMLGNLYRIATPESPNPTAWDYIWSGFLLLIGLSGLVTNVEILWALGPGGSGWAALDQRPVAQLLGRQVLPVTSRRPNQMPAPTTWVRPSGCTRVPDSGLAQHRCW